MIDTKLLDRICLTDAINDCCEGNKNCSECDSALRVMIAEHDKEIIQNYIDTTVNHIESLMDKMNSPNLLCYSRAHCLPLDCPECNRITLFDMILEIIKRGESNEK